MNERTNERTNERSTDDATVLVVNSRDASGISSRGDALIPAQRSGNGAQADAGEHRPDLTPEEFQALMDDLARQLRRLPLPIAELPWKPGKL